MSGTGMLQRHTGNSQLSAVESFPAPNACTSNAVKIPIMSLKCCEKSYVSCRPYCVGWRKYLNCSDAFTRCWRTDIHLLYFFTPDFIVWGMGSKVKLAYKILVLLIVNIIHAELLYLWLSQLVEHMLLFAWGWHHCFSRSKLKVTR